MKIITLGINHAENVLAVHAVDGFGKVGLARPIVRREQLLALMANLHPCVLNTLGNASLSRPL